MSKFILPLMLALIALFGCTGTTEQSSCEQFPEATECQLDTSGINDSLSKWANSLTGDFKTAREENLRLDTSNTGHLNVKFDTLREEQVATLELQDSMSCGIQFENDYSGSVDALNFLIDGIPHALIGYYTSGTYKEYLPCVIHTFRWELKKNKADGLTGITLGNIVSLDSPEYAYNGDWSFENGWHLGFRRRILPY